MFMVNILNVCIFFIFQVEEEKGGYNIFTYFMFIEKSNNSTHFVSIVEIRN